MSAQLCAVQNSELTIDRSVSGLRPPISPIVQVLRQVQEILEDDNMPHCQGHVLKDVAQVEPPQGHHIMGTLGQKQQFFDTFNNPQGKGRAIIGQGQAFIQGHNNKSTLGQSKFSYTYNNTQCQGRALRGQGQAYVQGHSQQAADVRVAQNKIQEAMNQVGVVLCDSHAFYSFFTSDFNTFKVYGCKYLRQNIKVIHVCPVM